MAMGTRKKRERQEDLWVVSSEVVGTPAHAFYDRLNQILDQHHFDRNLEQLCRRYYKGRLGRPSITPGVYFRSLLLGYFEGIDSERGIAWRLADSLSMREYVLLSGASRLSVVSGSCILTIPVSRRTVATHIVFEPDIGGYSVGSMMMKPATQLGWRDGTKRFACTTTLPRGSWSSSFRRESSRASACICSKTVSPGGAKTPPTMTLPTSPPAWHPMTVIVRSVRTCQL